MRTRKFLKMMFTPITIMMVPHSRTRPVSIRVPLGGIAFSVFSFFAGVVYLFTVAVHTVEYYQMRERLSYVTDQFLELQSTMVSLKQAEQEFKKLFSLKTKTDVLENAELIDTGSLDMEALRTQIDGAMRSVTSIRQYIAEQKDIYRATPKGWPVPGYVSSGCLAARKGRPAPGIVTPLPAPAFRSRSCARPPHVPGRRHRGARRPRTLALATTATPSAV